MPSERPAKHKKMLRRAKVDHNCWNFLCTQHVFITLSWWWRTEAKSFYRNHHKSYSGTLLVFCSLFWSSLFYRGYASAQCKNQKAGMPQFFNAYFLAGLVSLFLTDAAGAVSTREARSQEFARIDTPHQQEVCSLLAHLLHLTHSCLLSLFYISLLRFAPVSSCSLRGWVISATRF